MSTGTLTVATAEEMAELGRRLARVLRAGDLVLLTGELGAGKTTLARGIGAGLNVRGAVTSPTFVIARVHPPLGDGPPLVHVDAYRLGSVAEVDDLDLETSLAEAVTLVEWGAGLAEGLANERLEVTITRPHGGSVGADAAGNEPRTVTVRETGARWAGRDLPEVVAGQADEGRANGGRGASRP